MICPKCGAEVTGRTKKGKLRCTECDCIPEHYEGELQRVQQKAQQKQQRAYEKNEPARRRRKESLGWVGFVLFGLVATVCFIAAFGDNDSLTDKNMAPALLGLAVSVIALWALSVAVATWERFFFILFVLFMCTAVFYLLSLPRDSFSP